MLSQTLRFGVFIVVVMAGFALAFHAMFFSCDADSPLGGNFGTFPSALLYVFEAPLGEFDFTEFDGVRGQCPSHSSREQAASDAGIFLLVVSFLRAWFPLVPTRSLDELRATIVGTAGRSSLEDPLGARPIRPNFPVVLYPIQSSYVVTCFTTRRS